MLDEISIENLIYKIRDKYIMIDSDVARLFGYDTKQLNRQVFRNIDRFPEYYCFQLTETENKDLRCQIGTSSLGSNYGGRRYLPYAFTEYGIIMLAGILKSEIAVRMSVKIVDAFISMRKFINENKDIFKRLTVVEYKMLEYDDNFDKIFNALEPKKLQKQKIFFKGEIYDSYSLIIDIISKANNKIIIIDNYIDKSILDMLRYKKESVEVILVTAGYNNLDIEKFNKQYQISVKISNKFHDRFIVIDNILYHLGASLKDLGKKCFAINKFEDINYLNDILSLIE